MTDVAKVDETGGGVHQEDKAGAGGSKDKSSFLEDEIKTLRSANDALRTEKKKEVDAERVELTRVQAEAAKQREETETLRAAADTRAAEDKAELADIVSTMEPSQQKAIEALPGTPSERETLKYIKANPEFFGAKGKAAAVFSQATKSGGAAAATAYVPASLESLNGRAAIEAERQRLKETHGG